MGIGKALGGWVLEVTSGLQAGDFGGWEKLGW